MNTTLIQLMLIITSMTGKGWAAINPPAPVESSPPPKLNIWQNAFREATNLGGQAIRGASNTLGEVVHENQDLIRQRMAATMMGRDYIPPANPYLGNHMIGGYPSNHMIGGYPSNHMMSGPIPSGYHGNASVNANNTNPCMNAYGAYPSYVANISGNPYTSNSSVNPYDSVSSVNSYSSANLSQDIQRYGNPPVNYSVHDPSRACSGPTIDHYVPAVSTAYSNDGIPCCEQQYSSNTPYSMMDVTPQSHHGHSSFFGFDCSAAVQNHSSKTLLIGAALVAITSAVI